MLQFYFMPVILMLD